MSKAGKINPDFFKQNIQQQCGFQNKRILTKPAYGVDVSVVEVDEEKILISASDPMSYIPSLGSEDSAWLSVVLTSNDIATSGYAPQFAQVVLNLSDTMETQDFQTYWNHIHQICENQKISITGGHTGFVPGQNSTFAGGITMFAIGKRNHFFTSAMAKENDVILMTKEAALISTSILAKSFPETVKQNLGEEILEQCRNKFKQTSVLLEALIAAKSNGVSAMHDVTEGGILGAVYEMMVASEKGFRIDESQIPVSEETAKMSELFGYKPTESVGAGSLLITVHPDDANQLIQNLKEENIESSVLGTVKSADFGYKIFRNGIETEYEKPVTDSYWSAFYNAMAKGWK